MSHEPGAVLKPLVKLGRDPADCWTWLANVDVGGVASKQFGGKRMPARRWMWAQLFGPIPDGLVVTTACGSKTCVNPHHLRACTQADACRASVNTSLLPADVIDIKRAKKDAGPNTARVLADKHGCSPQTIRDIWKRRSWSRAKPNYGPRKNPTGSPAPVAAANPPP
ncbi:HNH endonuclease signature motif containing protein [Dokdonella soli]|uniref:HNH nuclease domain-containing protein n=1 Tax=Dokdonella soli TaxID=529810 RepID=A0ABN1IUF4_9GAMM